jgi:CheY-like chemotaxis protein
MLAVNLAMFFVFIRKYFLVMAQDSLTLNGLQVLVVDSDLDSRYLLKIVFEAYGIKTIAAASVAEALEILKQVTPDLLIGEIRLPIEDGYSLMRKVKALESVQKVQIPAIALTIYARQEDRDRALSAGFCKHLSKPFDIDELIEIIACLTRRTQGVAA